MLKKMILVFIKKILEKKIFIKSPYYERKKKKKKKKEHTHRLSPTTPSHTTKEISP